jgi:hypothetical protein
MLGINMHTKNRINNMISISFHSRICMSWRLRALYGSSLKIFYPGLKRSRFLCTVIYNPVRGSYLPGPDGLLRCLIIDAFVLWGLWVSVRSQHVLYISIHFYTMLYILSRSDLRFIVSPRLLCGISFSQTKRRKLNENRSYAATALWVLMTS